MNSPRRKNSDGQNFQAKTPHFFKIILSETIKDRKLSIPKVFVRKYEKDLKDSVYLKVPSGAVWQVELKRCDGYVWLQKGWDEFVEYYSIEHGHFLVFRYEGNSQFHVIIFDLSASEIEYPFSSTHAEEPSTDGEFQVPQMIKSENDDIAEMLDEILPFQKKTRESPLPCLRTRKRRITNSSSETGKSCKSHKSQKNVDSHSSLQKFGEAKEIVGQESASWQITRRTTRPKIPSAPESVSGFKSEYPFFAAVMLPTCLWHGYLNVPRNFVKGNISTCTMTTTAMLQVADRFWHVKFLRKERCKFSTGWPAFVKGHNLDLGDVCVFELIKREGFIFKVSILR